MLKKPRFLFHYTAQLLMPLLLLFDVFGDGYDD